jgi:hypothetical protein
MSLQEKLKHEEAKAIGNLTDRQALEEVGEVINSRITDLKRQIADSEVTYSIGDRFEDGTGRKVLLIMVDEDIIALVLLSDGRPWSVRSIKYRTSDLGRITKGEFLNMSDNCDLARYWDARKQCKC